MSYYDTIDDDLARATEILEKGKPTADGLDGIESPVILSLAGGAIYGADIYVAYKLLESFVAEIVRLRAALDDIADSDPTMDDARALISVATVALGPGCLEYRPDHNGECLTCDEWADAHSPDALEKGRPPR